MLVSDLQRLIYIFDFSSRHNKFYLRGRTITSQLMRSIAWLDDKRVIVTNFKGTCNLYSPNTSFDEETNYHKIIQCASFRDLNCLDFAALPIRLVTDAFGGVSRVCFVQEPLIGFLKLLLENFDQMTRSRRDALELPNEFFKDKVPVFYCEQPVASHTDLVTVFVESWTQFATHEKGSQSPCLDITRLVDAFSGEEIAKGILDTEAISADTTPILEIFRIFAELGNANE